MRARDPREPFRPGSWESGAGSAVNSLSRHIWDAAGAGTRPAARHLPPERKSGNICNCESLQRFRCTRTSGEPGGGAGSGEGSGGPIGAPQGGTWDPAGRRRRPRLRLGGPASRNTSGDSEDGSPRGRLASQSLSLEGSPRRAALRNRIPQAPGLDTKRPAARHPATPRPTGTRAATRQGTPPQGARGHLSACRGTASGERRPALGAGPGSCRPIHAARLGHVAIGRPGFSAFRPAAPPNARERPLAPRPRESSRESSRDSLSSRRSDAAWRSAPERGSCEARWLRCGEREAPGGTGQGRRRPWGPRGPGG